MKSIHEVSSFPQVRLKYLVNRIPGGTPDSRREEFWSDGTIPWISISDMSNRHSVGETAKKITPEARQKAGLEIGPAGTVLFAMYASVGEVAVTEIDAVWNQALIGLVPKSQRLSPSFLHYYLLAVRPYLPALYRSNTQNNLNAEQVENLRLPLPPRSQQEEIVAFLDRETAEIDAFIADQERLIELLEERRAATVAHAVTKGLDPNAPMKDSGIEWIGRVPSHWKVPKATWVGRVFSSAPTGEPELDKEARIPFLKVSSLSSTGLTPDPYHWFVTPGQNLERDFIVFPKRGAAIFGNKVNIVDGVVAMDPNLMGWKLGPQHSQLYFAYVLKTLKLEEIADVSTVPQINTKHMSDLQVPAPPLTEQRAIADFLNRETAELDAAVADAREAIALSRERRAALISAAVTGQLDVSQAQTWGSTSEVLEDEVRV